MATAAGRRRQRRRRAHEKNQRKCVMSGVEGALSTRTPRPRWPPRKRVMSGVEGRAAARRRHRRAATGRRRKGGRRPRVGDENSMLAARGRRE